MQRRKFISLLGGAAATLPLAARAQQGDRLLRRIGVLMPESEDNPESQARVVAFERRLQELGWKLGRNLQIDYRWGMGEVEKARAATADLVNLTPNVLIAVASPATAAMQRTTRTIPIVFVAVSEPVGQGMVASLAHPGGNMTYRGRGRSRPQGRFNFLRIPSGKASDGQSCWGCSRYIRSRARDHCDLVARPHRTPPTFGMAALRQ